MDLAHHMPTHTADSMPASPGVGGTASSTTDDLDLPELSFDDENAIDASNT